MKMQTRKSKKGEVFGNYKFILYYVKDCGNIIDTMDYSWKVMRWDRGEKSVWNNLILNIQSG